MLLPGGIVRSRERRRTCVFKALTGELELALSEHAEPDTTPCRVTAALFAALAGIDGEAPTVEVIDELCVADRQYLMHRLAEHLGVASRWNSATCSACGERFDLLIDLVALPVKPAGSGYPVTDVPTRQGLVRLRVPTGADQRSVAEFDDVDAVRRLVERCVVVGDGEPSVPVSRLDADDLAKIDTALEAMAPAVTTRIETSCPSCYRRNEVEVNPYIVLEHGSRSILDEVHALALAYHWSERDILALPTTRRREYLARVDHERGLTQ